MIQRFSSASAVVCVVIALAALGLRLTSLSNLEGLYLITTIWCLLPLVWGLWAIVIPISWVPHRLPLWGAILGVIVGLVVVVGLDMPYPLSGQTLPVYLKIVAVLLAVVLYYVLWMLVRAVYRSLAGNPLSP